MSFAGRIAGKKQTIRLSIFSARLRTSTRIVYEHWRNNLPEGWWFSLACAGSSMFVLSLIRILLHGLA